MENKAKKSEFKYWVLKKGVQDLESTIRMNAKDKLPALNLKKVRSITPEFSKILESSRMLSERLNKTIKILDDKTEKFVLPVEIQKIKEMSKPVSLEMYVYKDESIPGIGRSSLISLEKWLVQVLKDNSEEFDAVFSLFVQELAKEVSMQSVNSARLIVLLFVELQKVWKTKLATAIADTKLSQSQILSQSQETLKKLESELEFFKSGTNEYIQKYRKADDKNNILKRENDILKQVLFRLQHEYKLPAFNFSKVTELIIEDLADSSKRTQRKIVNTLAPKFHKNIIVQTDESKIIQISSKETQTKIQKTDQEVQTSSDYSENSTQTRKIKRKMGNFFQFSLKIYAKSNTFAIINRMSKQKTRNITQIKDVESSWKLKKMKKLTESLGISLKNPNASNFIHFSEFRDNLKVIGNQQVLYQSLETLTPVLNYNEKSRRSSRFSISSSLSRTSKGDISIDSFEKYRSRQLTPSPSNHFLPAFNKVLKSPSKNAIKVLGQCLKLDPKNLVLFATMSVHTLLKTIESMFYSCIIKLRKNSFQGFLDHVFRRLGNKYSFKLVKEKRLQDLIASSVLHKDLLMSKLFLRSLGAGKILGLSNYSVHTLRIILHLLSFFNSHIFGRPLFYQNERKMCQKAKVIEISKLIFKKTLDKSEYSRVLTQLENHSEPDQQGVKNSLIDIEWAINYLVFTFDYYEKQILEGVRKIIDALLVNESKLITKGEFILAVRHMYIDWENRLNDRDCLRIFPFLSEKVSNDFFLDSFLIEKICVHCGIFKAKDVDAFRESAGKGSVDEAEIDDLAFKLDGVGGEFIGEQRRKEELQRRLYRIVAFKDPVLAFAIYKKEIQRIIASHDKEGI